MGTWRVLINIQKWICISIHYFSLVPLYRPAGRYLDLNTMGLYKVVSFFYPSIHSPTSISIHLSIVWFIHVSSLVSMPLSLSLSFSMYVCIYIYICIISIYRFFHPQIEPAVPQPELGRFLCRHRGDVLAIYLDMFAETQKRTQ